MKGKIFTPDEANRMLPLVSRIADDIVATYADVNLALQAYETARARNEGKTARSTTAQSNDDHLLQLDERRRGDEVEAALDRFQALIEEVENLGGTVKDYENGEIDFYGEVDGEIVYLRWKRGEARISYWHGLEESANKRRLLPAASAA